MRFSDYVLTESGLQYKDLKEGTGSRFPKAGDQVVVDWDGYTIGYYGRIFRLGTNRRATLRAATGTSSGFAWVKTRWVRSKERLSVCLRVRG